MRGPVPLKFRNPLLITFLFYFNFIKDGYQKLTFTHFPLLISVFYVLFSIYFYLFTARVRLNIYYFLQLTVHLPPYDPASDYTTI